MTDVSHSSPVRPATRTRPKAAHAAATGQVSTARFHWETASGQIAVRTATASSAVRRPDMPKKKATVSGCQPNQVRAGSAAVTGGVIVSPGHRSAAGKTPGGTGGPAGPVVARRWEAG